jgi:hypothetical protein
MYLDVAEGTLLLCDGASYACYPGRLTSVFGCATAHVTALARDAVILRSLISPKMPLKDFH